MGLDNFWVKPNPEWDGKDPNTRFLKADTYEQPEGSEELSLCGGMLSGHGCGSFRGKVYSDLVEALTEQSLYQDVIENETVKLMAASMEGFDFKEAMEMSFLDIEEAEFKDLVKMFRIYADAGFALVGWW